MSVVNFRGVVFAFNCYLAAMAALFIGFASDLDNPWWSALTVFITSQPSAAASGALWARAWYRLVGTVAGMTASVVIIPHLVDVPELMMLTIAGWIALAIYLSLIDRSPRSYAFVLAGYTVALVGLPLINDPSTIFDTAVSRTEEILVGVMCAATVQTLVFPRRIDVMVQAKLASTLRDAEEWILAALGDGDAAPGAAMPARRKMASDLTELDALAQNLRFESHSHRRAERVLWSLEAQLVALLPLMVAVEDRVAALRALDALGAELRTALAETRAWISAVVAGTPSDDPDGRALTARWTGLSPLLTVSSTWPDLLVASLKERVVDLVEAWRAIERLSGATRFEGRRLGIDVAALLQGQVKRPLHVDHGLAAFSGLAAGVTILATALFVFTMGWLGGTAAIGIAAASSSVFASADDPTMFQRLFIKATCAAIPVAAFYVFAILPAVDGFGMLAFVLAPLFLLTGLYLTSPTYWLHAFGFALVSQTLIALQPSLRADFVVFTNIALGALGGAVCALVVTGLIRVIRAEVSARRILQAGWRELARLSGGSIAITRHAWASRMLDRQGLLLPRLARATGDESLKLADALNDLRVGVNVVALREAADDIGSGARAVIHRLLLGLSKRFDGLASNGMVSGAEDLLVDLDATLRELLTNAQGQSRSRALTSAAALRRNLFPLAPAFQPGTTP